MNLPNSLVKKIGNAIWEKDSIGKSGAGVYKLTGIEGGGNAYLKIASLGRPETLQEEMEKLKWLENKEFVPKILHYEVHENMEYLFMSNIEGENLKTSDWGIRHPVDLGKKVADGLLKIHEINTIDCPFNETIQMKLKKAKQRIQIGMVDPSDFEPTWLGKTAEQLYSMLEAGKPDDEDLVFTHGDFSIANIISNNNEVKGFVDWGRAGISDRHQDLAIAIRSLRHHFNGDSVEAFLDTYGRHKVDTKKVNYYMLLDELF